MSKIFPGLGTPRSVPALNHPLLRRLYALGKRRGVRRHMLGLMGVKPPKSGGLPKLPGLKPPNPRQASTTPPSSDNSAPSPEEPQGPDD